MIDKNSDETPSGELIVRTLAMPGDTNPNGHIFGGWLMSQMDIAGAIYTQKKVKGRVVTVAADSMKFIRPLYVGDTLCCYCHLIKVGRTSITIKIEAYAARQFQEVREKITEATFTYVKVDDDRNPIPVGEVK